MESPDSVGDIYSMASLIRTSFQTLAIQTLLLETGRNIPYVQVCVSLIQKIQNPDDFLEHEGVQISEVWLYTFEHIIPHWRLEFYISDHTADIPVLSALCGYFVHSLNCTDRSEA